MDCYTPTGDHFHIISCPAFKSEVSPLIAHVRSNTEYLTAILVFLQIYIYPLKSQGCL